MSKRRFLLVCLFVFAVQISINAQTHLAVPLGDPVYHVIEQAQIRGLYGQLPAARPYSRAFILNIIEQILDNDEERRYGKLTDSERDILEQFKETIGHKQNGLDMLRGTYSTERTINDVYFSGQLAWDFDFSFAGGYYPIAGGYKNTEPRNSDSSNIPSGDASVDNYFYGANHAAAGDFYSAIDLGVNISFLGDLGRNTSYGFGLGLRVLKNPRTVLGTSSSNYGWYESNYEPEHRYITVYSEPLAYFPYSYKKNWEGHLYSPSGFSADGMLAWPYDLTIGYKMMPEFSGALLDGYVSYRIASVDREWAGMTTNGSLVLNQSAQPFLGADITITPFSWLMISSLTGILEYHNSIGENNFADPQGAASTFQNAFSIIMLELNAKNYFHIGLGSSVIWPKRFELGYIFPFVENFIYQNRTGDFDNLALFLNLQGQYPGIGKIWASIFIDEFNPFAEEFFIKDRNMYAFQLGSSIHIPWLPFTSLTISYTKIEPYNYTHIRENDFPWYGDLAMETNYVNYGKSLGHYLPPNSDELLIRFETMPVVKSVVSLQYQLIRHGAEYGDRAVDGSSLWSELDPGKKRGSYKKYFLRDGAYQWMHILKVGGEYSLAGSKIPVRLYGEIGGVYSYFTDIDGEVNSGKPSPYRIINTQQYPHTLSFIANIGVKIFPKW